jgi:hypothetical protein
MNEGRAQDPVRHSFGERLVGAARLHVDTYEEVEADAGATMQAALVVALVSAATAIGRARADVDAILIGIVGTLASWLIWSGITYLIGDKFLGGTATWGELLRTIGFAQAPGMLFVLAAIPGLTDPVLVAVRLWIFVAVIIAIRQALDFSTGRAILTALFGFVVLLAIAVLLQSVLAPPPNGLLGP